MQIGLEDIMRWDQKYRIRFINSLSGYKAVHLIGTESLSGLSNVALFNSVVHIGSSPALLGFVMRPLTTERHTYRNILETQCYTINHVHKSFLKNAHYTSAKFTEGESEFDACHLTEEKLDQFQAPFVRESKVKVGLRLKDDIAIKENGARFIVGEIHHVMVEDGIIDPDGQLDLEAANNVCAAGLNQYFSVSKFISLPTAKLDELPDFGLKERPDNVVFDAQKQQYNAKLLAYGTNIGAPKIEATGVSNWKNTSINSFNHTFQNKIEKLKSSYKQLLDEYETNQMLYNAKMNFEPIVGEPYYLYFDDNKDEKFLSLIPPASWRMQYIGTFKLNHEKLWEKVD